MSFILLRITTSYLTASKGNIMPPLKNGGLSFWAFVFLPKISDFSGLTESADLVAQFGHSSHRLISTFPFFLNIFYLNSTKSEKEISFDSVNRYQFISSYLLPIFIFIEILLTRVIKPNSYFPNFICCQFVTDTKRKRLDLSLAITVQRVIKNS